MLKNNFAKIISILFLLCAMIPIVFLFSSLWRIENSNWNHLTLYLLPEISKNSMFLSLGVVACSTLIAIPIAYIQSFYDFPGRKLFDIFFLLPIVFPIYVYAAISLTLFGLTGDITSWLSSKLNISPFYFNIKNLFGLIIVFSFTLYPYLFITMREAFETHGERSLLVAKSLGLTKRNALFKILIPLTRPWYSAGVILVIMEVLADFGATSLFNINTFTTAIYRAWFGLFSFDTASQIASLFLIIIFLAVFLYRNNEERKNYSMSSKYLKIEKQKLIGWKLISVYFFYFIFLIFVIGLPLFFLLKEVFLLLRNNWIIFSKFDFFGPLKNSFNFGLSGAIVILLFAYVLGYAKRFELSRKDLWWFELTKLGYAIPGTIMAVAIYVPMSIIEKKFVGKNVLTITVIPLIVGYILRFLPVALNPIEVSFKKISESHVQFTKIIGLSNYYKWMKFYFPITASAAIYSFCMLFLEIIKELPITLMTRPFGKDTLAIKIFEYTSESDWTNAAVPSLLLVCLGGIAVLIIYFKLKDKIN